MLMAVMKWKRLLYVPRIARKSNQFLNLVIFIKLQSLHVYFLKMKGSVSSFQLIDKFEEVYKEASSSFPSDLPGNVSFCIIN